MRPSQGRVKSASFWAPKRNYSWPAYSFAYSFNRCTTGLTVSSLLCNVGDAPCSARTIWSMPRRTQSVKNHRKKDAERSPSENGIRYNVNKEEINLTRAYNSKATRLHQRPVSIEYEIERIITDRSTSKQQEFLCKWKDFPLHQSSWLPKNLLNNAQETLTQYLTPPNPHPNPI